MASPDLDDRPASFDDSTFADVKSTIDAFVTGKADAVHDQFHARLDSQRAQPPVVVGLPGRPARPRPTPAVPPRPPYSQRKGLVRDKDLLTLAEALNDDVPRNCRGTRLLWKVVDKLEYYGVEAFGIERTLTPASKTTTLWDLFWFWLTPNVSIATVALGALASSFRLPFNTSAIVIVVFNVVALVPFAYNAIFGARTGLRQIVFSRFSFGYYPCCVVGVLNAAQQIGWSVCNVIVGAQTLRACSTEHRVPIAAGVVIIALLTLYPSTAGLKQAMFLMRWSWAGALAGLIALVAKAAPSMAAGNVEHATGSISDALSFGSLVAVWTLGWLPNASDYSVRLPDRTSSVAIMAVVYIASLVPIVLFQILGAALTTRTLANEPSWEAAHNDSGVGGLVGIILTQKLGGFGSFLTVLIALSIVPNNVPNLCSFALTVQTFGKWFQAIPRLFVCLFGSLVYSVLAAVSRGQYDGTVELFLGLLSYWLASYTVILIQEHVLFRKAMWSNYRLDEVHKPGVLPPGIAALLSLVVGFVGALLGMDQAWWRGPLSPHGADIGLELAAIFSALSYPPLRLVELAYFGR